MDLYSGAIDYMVYKLESKYIIILLDNHNPSTYCSGSNFDPKSNIDILFESFISKKSIFVLEELVPTQQEQKSILLYHQTPHLVKYMQFYTKYKSNKEQIIPIDLRILFDNFSQSNKYELLDELFGIIPCVNFDVNIILSVINMACSNNSKFIEHFESLKTRYKELKIIINSNSKKCLKSSYLEEIYLNYPFESTSKELNECEHIEQLLSGLLELYGIAQILITESKYVFVYLGASHCISIGWILEKYYKIRKIKDLDKFETNVSNFNLSLFDKSTKSCIQFQPI
jgi:hypothetical protein